MNNSNTHRKPILLYCSQPTQTHDDSESEDSDFPSCRIGNDPPLISRSPLPIPTHSRYLPAGSQQLTTLGEKEPHQSQRCGQPNNGLGQTNIINTLDATLKVLIFSLVQVAMLNVNVRLIVPSLFAENIC